MARQPEGGYMEWPAAPRWMEPLLGDDAGRDRMVTVSRLANADLERLRSHDGAGGGGGGVRREDLRFPVAPRGKYQAVQGAFPQGEGEDRLIPGNGKTVYMSCGQPSKYLPRRRKLPPVIADNRVLVFNYESRSTVSEVAVAAETNSQPTLCAQPRAPDVSSVTGRRYSRRKMIPQPVGFFGYQGQPVSQSSNQSLRRALFEEKI